MKRTGSFVIGLAVLAAASLAASPPAAAEPNYCNLVRMTSFYQEEMTPEVPWNQLSAASKKHYLKMRRYYYISAQRALGALETSSVSNAATLAKAWRIYVIDDSDDHTDADTRWAAPIFNSILVSCGIR